MDPDPHFDPNQKLFLKITFFTFKTSFFFYQAWYPDLFQTLDPDPHEMDANPKPCL